MRMLLMLDDEAARTACTDYYVTRGCDVDAPSDVMAAEGLLRFRHYDVLVADFPREECSGTLRILDVARRKGPMLRVLLTTDGTSVADDDLVVLTKPQPLDAILARM
ncbi:MAG: hypothetical protein ACXW5H_28190 [Thermoanaerobaculia bacterium]